MSNGPMHGKSTSWSCCLHDSSHASKPVLYCSWLMLVPKYVLVLRLIIITRALQLNDPSDKGLWGGLVRGQKC